MGEINKERLRLVREALDHWPSFVLHISRRLTAAADNFRLGEDVRAVKLLRIGIDDLGDFMTWVEEIHRVVCDSGRTVNGTEQWRRRLVEGAGVVREAVARANFTEAADRIEIRLVNELMSSAELADRMCDKLAELQGTPGEAPKGGLGGPRATDAATSTKQVPYETTRRRRGVSLDAGAVMTPFLTPRSTPSRAR